MTNNEAVLHHRYSKMLPLSLIEELLQLKASKLFLQMWWPLITLSNKNSVEKPAISSTYSSESHTQKSDIIRKGYLLCMYFLSMEIKAFALNNQQIWYLLSLEFLWKLKFLKTVCRMFIFSFSLFVTIGWHPFSWMNTALNHETHLFFCPR